MSDEYYPPCSCQYCTMTESQANEALWIEALREKEEAAREAFYKHLEEKELEKEYFYESRHIRYDEAAEVEDD